MTCRILFCKSASVVRVHIYYVDSQVWIPNLFCIYVYWLFLMKIQNHARFFNFLSNIGWHLIPALNAWAALAEHTTARLTAILGMNACMTSNYRHSFRDLCGALMCLAYFLTYYTWVFVQPGRHLNKAVLRARALYSANCSGISLEGLKWFPCVQAC